MDIVVKCTAAAMLAAVAGITVKRSNPEFALLISISAVTVLFLSLSGTLAAAKDVILYTEKLLPSEERFVKPLMKCVAIAVVGRLGSDMCKEASQTALASAVDFAATLSAAAVSAPVITGILGMVGSVV